MVRSLLIICFVVISLTVSPICTYSQFYGWENHSSGNVSGIAFSDNYAIITGTSSAKIDISSWEIDYIPVPDRDAGRLQFNNVAVIGPDKTVFGSEEGLHIYNNVFWVKYDKSNSGLKSNSVTALCTGADGCLWIGMGNAGFAKYYRGSWKQFNVKNSILPGNNVNCMTMDRENSLWVGSDKGLISFNGGVWKIFNDTNSVLLDNNIKALCIDKAANTWVASADGSIACLDRQNAKVYTKQDIGQNYKEINCLFAGKDFLYVGTDKGLILFDGESWIKYLPTNAGFLNSSINAVYEDSNSRVWIACTNGCYSAEYITILSLLDQSIIINAPQENEQIVTGSDYYISWISAGIDNIKLELSIDDEKSWKLIETDIPATDASYCWHIPDIASSDRCAVRISDANNPEVYSIIGDFAIVKIEENPGIEKIHICAYDSSVHYTQYKTDPEKLYKITVSGKFSIWNMRDPCRKVNEHDHCCGIDAAYVYDVPERSIDMGAWPDKSNFKLPHWVGDNSIMANNYIDGLNLRENIGFRFNGKPLPNSGYNKSHVYKIVGKPGTGDYFRFQILDIIQEPGSAGIYEENCNCLKITVEEMDEIAICDSQVFCHGDTITGIQIDAAIMVKDSLSSLGYRNIISEIDPEQLIVAVNGRAYCPDISIECDSDTSKPLRLGIVVDRSNSMGMSLSETDMNIRMNISKKAINNFIGSLPDNAEAFIMSFSNYTSLDQDWTSDKNAMRNTINRVRPGGGTQLFGALNAAIDKLENEPLPRAIVLLSDGYNSSPPSWYQSDIYNRLLSMTDIPIYIVALGLGNNNMDIEGRQKLELIARASNGKVFDANSSEGLCYIFDNMIDNINTKLCCRLYFDIFNVECPGTIRLIYAPTDEVLLSKVLHFECCREDGSAGAVGTEGAAGSVGTTGTTGSVGTTGNTGSVGSTGTTGSVGTTSNTGSVGSTGTTGSVGTTGNTGNVGTTGACTTIGTPPDTTGTIIDEEKDLFYNYGQ